MIFIAQLSTNVPAATTNSWVWGLAGFATLLGAILFCWNQGMKALGKDKQNITQPLAVEITKTLHEQFAGKVEFEHLKAHTTQRHSQIFASLERVEREARKAMDDRFKELNEERRQTLDKLTTEFVFIRENIAAINRELKIRHEQD